jgi:hypothetical protein
MARLRADALFDEMHILPLPGTAVVSDLPAKICGDLFESLSDDLSARLQLYG